MTLINVEWSRAEWQRAVETARFFPTWDFGRPTGGWPEPRPGWRFWRWWRRPRVMTHREDRERFLAYLDGFHRGHTFRIRLGEARVDSHTAWSFEPWES